MIPRYLKLKYPISCQCINSELTLIFLTLTLSIKMSDIIGQKSMYWIQIKFYALLSLLE